jgi:cysteine desulfurase
MTSGTPARERVYLDYNATSPVRPEAIDAMRAALAATGNPSSVHAAGRAARQIVERSREAVAALVGAPAEAVVFTSGGTEANDLALAQASGRCVASAIEHDSVLAAVLEARRIRVDRDGRVDFDALADLLQRERPPLVSVMLANNETGVIQPVAEVAALGHRHGALVHCDAVQAAGKIAIDFTAMGVDLMSLSAHKLGGPQGVGALVVAPGVELRPRRRGDAQESRRRAGTENVAGIAGFARAAELTLADGGFAARVAALRDGLEAEIAAVAPSVRVLGSGASRLPTTSCLTMPGVAAETQLIAFDLDGIAISSGSACSSGKVGPSHVLAAMGVAPAEARCAIRVSLGWASREADVERFIAAWARLWSRAGRAAGEAAPARAPATAL